MNDFNCCESVNTNTSKAEQDALITLGMIVALTELGKNNEKIKELNAENFKLKEENTALKKEKELFNEYFGFSEEIKKYCTEGKAKELREEISYLERKISSLEDKLSLQIQLNVELVRELEKNK